MKHEIQDVIGDCGNSANKEDGFLVTIEGIDGSGKSTVWDSLSKNDFSSIPSDITFTREPTSASTGKLLRENLSQDDADGFTELFLFMADHANHLDSTIQPALEDDGLIICDRYIDSRCAYQGHTLSEQIENPIEFVENLHRPWSRFPDCTILLELDTETAVKRTFTGEKYEREDQLKHIKENYDALREAHPHRFVSVDASNSPEQVYSDVVDAILTQYNETG